MVVTVEEFLKSKKPQDMYADENGITFSYTPEQVAALLIEFACIHCEAQAKVIVEKTKLIPDENQDFRLQSCNCVDYVLDTESILNAYSLDNIK